MNDGERMFGYLILIVAGLVFLVWLSRLLLFFSVVLTILGGLMLMTRMEYGGRIFLLGLVISVPLYGVGYVFPQTDIGEAVFTMHNGFQKISSAPIEAERKVLEESRESTEEVSEALNNTNSTVQKSADNAFDLMELAIDIQGMIPYWGGPAKNLATNP